VGAKVYCGAVPVLGFSSREPVKRYFGLFLAPVALIARKSWRWRPEQRVDWQLDVEDGRYFSGAVRAHVRCAAGRQARQPARERLARPRGCDGPCDSSIAPHTWLLLS